MRMILVMILLFGSIASAEELPADTTEAPRYLKSSVQRFEFRVEALAEQSTVRFDDKYLPSFSVLARVYNSAARDEYFYFETEFFENWITDNPFVYPCGGARSVEPTTSIPLKPGEMYSGTFNVCVSRKAPKGPLSFHVGFDPTGTGKVREIKRDGTTVFWSNTLNLDVVD